METISQTRKKGFKERLQEKPTSKGDVFLGAGKEITKQRNIQTRQKV